MSSNVPFGRLLTAMATAFHEDGSVDLDATARIAAHLVDHGNDGVVVSGTTGESPTTSVAEDGEILRAVQDAVGDRATVIAGVGTNATAHSVELARQAEKIGVDGVLLVSPYYNKPGQVGLRHHFTSVVEATDLPVMLYDVPGRTATPDRARDLRGDALLRRTWSRSRRPPASSRAPRSSSTWATPSTPVTTWPRSATSPTAACGLVSVVAHAAGTQLASMIDAWVRGDHAEALRVHTSLLPAFDAVMGVPNYGATTAKAALELLGVIDNRRVRGPLVALDDDEVAALRSGLAAAGLL